MILGPWIGGVLCAVSVPLAYETSALLYAAAGVAVFFIAANTKPDHQGGKRLQLRRLRSSDSAVGGGLDEKLQSAAGFLLELPVSQ